MKHKLILIGILAILTFSCQKSTIQQKIDLSGEWNFAIDSLDKGTSEKWFDQTLSDKVILPGSMTSNGKGDDITLKTPWTGQIVDSSYYKNPGYAKYRIPGNIKIPFWLQPVKYYKGAAWYQKEVTIPEDWNGQFVELFLERCHWESRLWVDNNEVGVRNSLGTPHKYDLSNILTPGKHRLTLCIDNRVKDIDPGMNSHSISDHTQSNWNGAVGQLYLEARPVIHLQNIRIFPDIQNKKIAVKVNVQNPTGVETSVKLNLSVLGTSQKESESFDLKRGENILGMSLDMGSDAKL
ncbi:MAG: sugar-binding domain-containing protein, partial [Prolixibacteraceae bacterium]